MKPRESYKYLRSVLLGIDPIVMPLYYKTLYKPKPNSLAERMNEVAKGKKDFKFLQVGGNDGYINDPIFRFIKKYGWKGIIVEPQVSVFKKRLKNTYRLESKVILENLAISDQSGLRKLYKIAVSDSRWATGLASFNREVIERQVRSDRFKKKTKREGLKLGDNYDDFITYEEVNCITISDLLAKHHFDQLDLLQIDTEGYDFEIIKTIDFNQMKPKYISFEHFLIKDIDKEKCFELLKSNGYELEHFGGDTFAVLC